MSWSDRIGRRVRLRDLHILLAVAQTGSMVRAAKNLAISQPVVSKTISDLEHVLGVRLLDRSTRGLEPTAYGRAFIDCGTAVFDELRRGVQAIDFLSDPTCGSLPVLRTARPQAAQVITLRHRTPNPISKLFVDDLRAFAGSLDSGAHR
jgi:DNA-binding transcriptional LysR family regulator